MTKPLTDSKSDSLERFGRSRVTTPPAEGQIDSTGRKMALATIYVARCGCLASTVGCDRDRLLTEFGAIIEEDKDEALS